MFLQNEPKHIEDFLQALSFLPPKGTQVSYFITPLNSDSPKLQSIATSSNYNVEPNIQNIPGITDTLTFTKKALRNTHSSSRDNLSPYSTPGPMPKSVGGPELLTQDVIVSGGQIESPEKLNRITKVLESNSRYIDIQLQEAYKMFPVNTIFRCTRG